MLGILQEKQAQISRSISATGNVEVEGSGVVGLPDDLPKQLQNLADELLKYCFMDPEAECELIAPGIACLLQNMNVVASHYPSKIDDYFKNLGTLVHVCVLCNSWGTQFLLTTAKLDTPPSREDCIGNLMDMVQSKVTLTLDGDDDGEDSGSRLGILFQLLSFLRLQITVDSEAGSALLKKGLATYYEYTYEWFKLLFVL